ncbi:MAG: hypothetical protein AB7G52_10135 [Arcobacter sp.]
MRKLSNIELLSYLETVEIEDINPISSSSKLLKKLIFLMVSSKFTLTFVDGFI